MPVWKNYDHRRPKFSIQRDFDALGAGARETRLEFDMHTGTHIDAPLHFLPNGASIDQIALEQLIRPVKVLDFTQVDNCITKADLAKHQLVSGDFILLKTRNSFSNAFDPEFVYLDWSGAQYLVERQLRGVGIDALGIERAQNDHATHKTLLGHGIVIIEGLRLAAVAPGNYLMVAAPLKIRGVEAAPARVFLVDEQKV